MGLGSLFGKSDVLKDVVGYLLKQQIDKYSSGQMDDVLVGLENQGLAEPVEGGILVRVFVPDDADTEDKMNKLLALARGIRRAVEYAAKHGGSYKGG